MIERKLRIDAQRNHDAIVAAADAAFRLHGIDASVDEIAGRAGVGVGTLYRNFPTKEALLHAVLTARVAPLLAEARAAEASEDAGAAFFGFLRTLCGKSQEFKALADALARSGFDLKASKSGASGELMTAMERLMARAQSAGVVRGDITLQEVHMLMSGFMQSDWAADQERMSRCTDLVIDALRLHANAPTRRGARGRLSPEANEASA